jgi:TolA-binding protein
MRSHLLAAALLLAAAGGCASASGGTPPARDPETVRREEAEAAVLFGNAEALRARGEWDDARSEYTDVYEDYPGSRHAQEAQYLAAECAFRAGRLFAAGELFGRYVEEVPLSGHVLDVERRMYEIGERLIEDGRGGLFGLGLFSTSEEGVQVLRRMATLIPTGTYADDALLQVGRWYFGVKDYVGAETTLGELLKDHPTSEWRLEARYVLAWTYRRDNRGPAYDGAPERAAEYADRIARSREEIEAIDADLARKALLRARFYVRTGKESAALTVLRQAALKWGSTEPGRECARRAEEMAPPAEGAH